MNRQKFMQYFRSEAFGENMSVEDRKEIFLQCLLGSSDITKDLLQELFNDYSVDNLAILEIKKVTK